MEATSMGSFDELFIEKSDSSLKVDVGSLLSNPGKQFNLSGSVDVGKISTSMASMEGELAFDLVLEAQAGDILINGDLKVIWVGQCRRCLEPVKGGLDIKIKESFQKKFVEFETYPLVGTQVDLHKMFLEAVILELPLAPLCSTDCKGPVPEAFIENNNETSDHRWDALKDFEE